MPRIRLERKNVKHKYYNITVIDSRFKNGSGRLIEVIGQYHALKKTDNVADKFTLNMEKYAQYIKNGAQPSDAVIRLVKKLNNQ